MLDDYHRARSALAINYLQVFSLEQLAAIARMSAKDLREMGAVEYAEGSGKVNPESINTLRLFHATYYSHGKISQPLLHIMLRDGTDLKAVSQITGIPLEELK